MVESVPVLSRITIVNGVKRYVNGNIDPNAPNGNVLAFAQALNSLQYGAPADAFIKTQKFELKSE